MFALWDPDHHGKFSLTRLLGGAVLPHHSVERRQPSGDRASRIERIRQQIAAGTYDTEARLDAAMDRMLDDLTVAEDTDAFAGDLDVASDHYQEVA